MAPNGWGITCGGAALVLTGSTTLFKERRQLNALVRLNCSLLREICYDWQMVA
jgi:hypothetical protein